MGDMMQIDRFSRGIRFAAGAVALAAGISAGSLGALAETGTGQPAPWQIGMQTAVTPIASEIHGFHTWLLVIITAITVFVAGLLAWCIFRFNEKANPTPSKTTHHTILEVAWTIVPVLILVVIAIPSFRLLRNQLILPKIDITVKATGHAWYWEYEYAGAEKDPGFKFDSNLIEEADLKPGQPRLLTVDNEMVVPVGKNVRVQTTGADVIHSYTVPSFGIKVDAVPGRLNETWFRAEREGVYHGQCSELCGQRHAFMPITVRVVSEQEYTAWWDDGKKKYASTGAPPHYADAASR